eukprot:2805763-Amphidinium_carterae.1
MQLLVLLRKSSNSASNWKTGERFVTVALLSTPILGATSDENNSNPLIIDHCQFVVRVERTSFAVAAVDSGCDAATSRTRQLASEVVNFLQGGEIQGEGGAWLDAFTGRLGASHNALCAARRLTRFDSTDQTSACAAYSGLSQSSCTNARSATWEHQCFETARST